MDGNFIVVGCLLAAFFAAGILFDRWMEFGMGGCDGGEEGDEAEDAVEGDGRGFSGGSGRGAAGVGGRLAGEESCLKSELIGDRGRTSGGEKDGYGGGGESIPAAAANRELSVEEQWDNLLRYDGNPQKKKEEKGA